jgi:hypothetical protein
MMRRWSSSSADGLGAGGIAPPEGAVVVAGAFVDGVVGGFDVDPADVAALRVEVPAHERASRIVEAGDEQVLEVLGAAVDISDS